MVDLDLPASLDKKEPCESYVNDNIFNILLCWSTIEYWHYFSSHEAENKCYLARIDWLMLPLHIPENNESHHIPKFSWQVPKPKTY